MKIVNPPILYSLCDKREYLRYQCLRYLKVTVDITLAYHY